MTLDQAPKDVPVTVLSARADSVALARRLGELGIRAGSVLRVQTRTSGGGAILAIGEDRIAVARTILQAVTVGPSGSGADGG